VNMVKDKLSLDS